MAWGDAASIVQRVREHFDAGADHVSIQVLLERMPQQAVVRRTAPGHGGVPRGVDPVPLPEREWRELAPALLAL